MDCLEVERRADAMQVEQVLTHAEVAGAPTVLAGDMRKSVFDDVALAWRGVAVSLRSPCWSRSSSAMLIVRPVPGDGGDHPATQIHGVRHRIAQYTVWLPWEGAPFEDPSPPDVKRRSVRVRSQD